MSEIHVEGYCVDCGRYTQAWRERGTTHAFTCDDCERRDFPIIGVWINEGTHQRGECSKWSDPYPYGGPERCDAGRPSVCAASSPRPPVCAERRGSCTGGRGDHYGLAIYAYRQAIWRGAK